MRTRNSACKNMAERARLFRKTRFDTSSGEGGVGTQIRWIAPLEELRGSTAPQDDSGGCSDLETPPHAIDRLSISALAERWPVSSFWKVYQRQISVRRVHVASVPVAGATDTLLAR